jgi:hypothetical protein
MTRVLGTLAIGAFAVLCFAGAAAAVPPAPQPHCNPAPDSCEGWYRSDVSITWSFDPGWTSISCDGTPVTGDTTGTSRTCSVTYPSGTVSTTVTIKRDATPPTVSAAASRAPDHNGWYNRPVGVSFSGTDATSGIASCSSPTYSGPDGSGASVGGGCTDQAGNSASSSVSIKYDATAPSVTGRPERAPDSGGWYRRPVGVSFAGSDATSGVASCSSGSYGGPDAAQAAVNGTCADVAGNTGPGSLALRYDATAPAASAAADRPPDQNGWYNHALTIKFNGTDALSGLAACDQPVVYKGPDRAKTTVSGKCRDVAGNVSNEADFAFRFDHTAPTLRALTVDTGDRMAKITVTVTKDASTIEISRAPGLRGQKRSVVYRGRARSFVDRKVRNGVRYWYAVRILDEAGNVVERGVKALPRLPVFAPRAGAVVSGPPLVSWTPVRRARFYNVQLFLGATKVLTTWVTQTRYRLPRSWELGGERHELVAGRYRVLVWPAFGTRTQPRYGKLLGVTTFVVRTR